MDHKSPIEMIHLGVEYILISVFFILVGNALSVRNELADSINELFDNQKNIKQYREFNSYDMGECLGEGCMHHIYGDEVIEIIRRYYDNPEFEIYIDKTSESGSSLTVNYNLATLNPDAYSLENLQTLIDSKAEFHPYLVYDALDPSTIHSYQNGKMGNVTGITLIWKTDNKAVTPP